MKYETLGEYKLGEMVEVKARETKGETVGPHLKVDRRRFFGSLIGCFIGCFLVMVRSVVNASTSKEY
jgi:hypothetical protein